MYRTNHKKVEEKKIYPHQHDLMSRHPSIALSAIAAALDVILLLTAETYIQ